MHTLGRSLVVAAAAAGIFPSSWGVQAAEPSRAATPVASRPEQVVVHDVALRFGGVLQGQVLNPQGQPIVTRVQLRQQAQVVAQVTTQSDGRFEFTGVRGGTYLVESPHASGLIRAWTATAAPPAAREGLLLVGGPNGVQRGQIAGLAGLAGAAGGASQIAVVAGTVGAVGFGAYTIYEDYIKDDSTTSSGS